MQNREKLMAIAAGLLIVAGVWLWCAGRNDVSDIGKRADETRSELKSAREEQRDQAAALDRAEGAIRDSAERADRVQSLERSDAEIIRESQSIIDRVRERGPAQGTDEG